MLLQIVEDGREVEAEEGVCGTKSALEVLDLLMERGGFEEVTVLPVCGELLEKNGHFFQKRQL